MDQQQILRQSKIQKNIIKLYNLSNRVWICYNSQLSEKELEKARNNSKELSKKGKDAKFLIGRYCQKDKGEKRQGIMVNLC